VHSFWKVLYSYKQFFSEKPSITGNDNPNRKGKATDVPNTDVEDKNNETTIFLAKEHGRGNGIDSVFLLWPSLPWPCYSFPYASC
jgi:hypothetical protein